MIYLKTKKAFWFSPEGFVFFVQLSATLYLHAHTPPKSLLQQQQQQQATANLGVNAFIHCKCKADTGNKQTLFQQGMMQKAILAEK